jgi:hypothetical protein
MLKCDNCNKKYYKTRCDNCYTRICTKCIHEIKGNYYCKSCYNNLKHKLDLNDSDDKSDKELCSKCKKELTGDYNDYKFCTMCEKHYCILCIALTACQTTDGYCVNCFDYKCVICKNDLDKPYKKLYLDDNEPTPICKKCKRKNK